MSAKTSTAGLSDSYNIAYFSPRSTIPPTAKPAPRDACHSAASDFFAAEGLAEERRQEANIKDANGDEHEAKCTEGPPCTTEDGANNDQHNTHQCSKRSPCS